MSLIVANPFIRSSVQSGHVPMIGYDNIFELSAATITVTDEASGYPKEYAYDWLPHRQWKGNSGAGTYYYTVDAGSSQTADYFGVYAHNFATAGGTVTCQCSADNATWDDVTSGFTPTDTAPIMQAFGSYSRRYWRLKIVTTTSAPAVGALAIGQRLEPEHGHSTGKEPPNFAAIYESVTNTSENGVFIGQSRRLINAKVDINFRLCTTAWVKNSWVPFMTHVSQKPFFYAWSGNNRPTEVAFCWLDAKMPKNPSYTDFVDHSNVGMQVRGAII